MTSTFVQGPLHPVPEILNGAGEDSTATEPDEESVPVDQVPDPKVTAYTRITAAREGSKQPVIVDWLRDSGQRKPIVRWALGYAWHVVKFHAVRLWLYAIKLSLYAPIGAGRVIRSIWCWVRQTETLPIRREALLGDESAWRALEKERKEAVRLRWRVVAALTVAALSGLGLLLWCTQGWQPQLPWMVWPTWAWWPLVRLLGLPWPHWLLLVTVVLSLGYHGRPRHKPLISAATTPAHLSPVLRMDSVEAALRSLPISALSRADARIEFPDPIIRDGPGYLARVNLPLGVTPTQVMGKREELASGLRRPLGCVWPESGASEHGGLLKLWVGFQDMATARQPAYPLLKGTADLFKPIPYGTDNRGRKVGIDLVENNVLIGAMPGAGKTTVIRTLACGCALDVTAELHVWEMKGSGDLAPLERVAHRYGSGMDDETIRACLADLRELRDDIQRRAAQIKKLSKATPESCPDSKTTRQLANRRNLGLHPVVIFLDEVQNLYSHETYGSQAEKIVLDIIRMGRAFGVILVQATQRPDKDSLPKAISAQAGIRICLRVMGYIENDMILGTGAYNRGISAATFTKRDRGVAYLVGVADDAIVAKSFHLSGPDADRIAQRARALREEAGRLTGYAAGELDEDPNDGLIYSLLADAKRVMVEASREWMWSEEIIAGLAELRPAHYSAWTTEQLAKNLTAVGVDTRQMNRTGPDGVRRNLRGVDLSQLTEAIAKRNETNVVPLPVAGAPATRSTGA